MGFNEDDRIRRKNRVHDFVYTEYSSLKDKGFTESDIRSHFESNYSDTQFRNEILLTINKIVGRNNDEGISSN